MQWLAIEFRFQLSGIRFVQRSKVLLGFEPSINNGCVPSLQGDSFRRIGFIVPLRTKMTHFDLAIMAVYSSRLKLRDLRASVYHALALQCVCKVTTKGRDCGLASRALSPLAVTPPAKRCASCVEVVGRKMAVHRLRG